MRIADAKRVPIVEILAAKGFSPQSVRGNTLMYLSPFRNEKTASFKVDLEKNVWFDFGSGEGGDSINIVQMLFNEPNTSNALAMMDNYAGLHLNPVVSVPIQRQPTLETLIHSVREIENFALEKFLKMRGISPGRAKRYLSEIHYQRGDSSYFALAHPNEAGGFEVKNALFSGSVNQKAMTCIPGENSGGKVAIFEGMFDFLALLELHKIDTPPHDVIILNSLSLLKRSAERVTERSYSEVNLYFDNDTAGKKAAQDFEQLFEATSVSLFDQSKSYSHHKDINDYLLEKKKKQIALDITISKQDPFTL